MNPKIDYKSQKIGATKIETGAGQLPHQPSDKERDVVRQNRFLFRLSADDRNRSFENFDGLNIVQYIEESYRRYTTNINVRDDIEDWQSAVHDKFTANKVDAILGKIVAVLPIAEVQGRGDEDLMKGIIMSNLYEYSEDIDDYDEFMIAFLQEAIVKGTAIGYEGQKIDKRSLRFVKGSGDDITVFEGSKADNKLFSQVVKLEDFYPSSVGVRRIKDMPRCFWRDVMSFQQFQNDYLNVFEKAKYVKPHKTEYAEGEQRPYYFDYISNDVRDGEVEVIRRYDKEHDQFVIDANGIWLNPITTKDGVEDICPLPFNHKELPFFDVKYQQFSSDFFYGRGLPDKLKSMQDVLDVMTNMLLDQSFLTIFPPILTNGFDSIEDDYLRPGRRTPVDTGGLPINQAFMKLDLGTPSNWHQFILQYTRSIMEESSLDRVSSGQAGQGDRTTATEVSAAAAGVEAMIGLFGKWVKTGVKRKAYLRTKNIAQFWMDAKSPMVELIDGQGGSANAKKAFNTFKIDGASLSDGKRGTKVIEIYKNQNDLPTQQSQQIRSMTYELANNKKIEYVAISADYLRTMDFDIKLVPSTKSDVTKDVQKALQLEKVRVYLSFFPDLVDRNELLAETAQLMGDDPTKIMKPQQQASPLAGLQQGQGQQGQNPMQDQGSPQQPTWNLAQNMVMGMGRSPINNAPNSVGRQMLG